ncbi:MAG: MGMT family protein [Pseudomonadota bacterium]
MNQQPASSERKDDRFEKIWAVVASIPHGCVLNYGEVARLAGLPGRARMVGRALGRAPKAMKLPWFRVVNAQGAISFKKGSRPYQLQRDQLEAEGVVFVKDRIDLKAFSPEQAVDRLLWGPVSTD